MPARPEVIRVEAEGYRPFADARPTLPPGRDVPYDVELVPVPGLRGLVLADKQPSAARW
ncbi:MAG: hypothetical protein R3F43_04650 [bacterium]